MTQQAISTWMATVEPKPSVIGQIERALGVPTGFLYVLAGLVNCPGSTIESLRMDPALRGISREHVIETYENAVRRSGTAATKSAAKRKRPVN